ncbi:MAG: type I methionyl aminopeptidase [candidate division Zixibacteria bacterium]|nr:type I methionyl aminopeptidase [candidate division Zixibacteria bacterium]NIR67710.1 type I methionyl aminopeptidase [candidate division Zixibacteria bacterium]NIS16776.1 type I methionyl aminopeptidase [candidate division Zixibacteria bacterium]NIS48963.1 type I methionyl aminopeptidase [candidate division Zixibacteria bacterium]NIT53179.1 type I methionyl aminopeptidase [candidate division Zixibacteria bacterium]
MIELKSPREIELMRAAGKIVAETHKLVKEEAKPGVSTLRLDELAEEYIRSQGAVPSFLNYSGYPATLCISFDDQVVHGIPSKNRVIKEGQLVKIDVGAKKDGYHGDAAKSFYIGELDEKTDRLLSVTETALMRGIGQAVIGNFLGDISFAIQKTAEDDGFSVVRDLVGHGIGKNLHEEPQVPNYGNPRTGVKLEEGMTIAIEPMVNEGGWAVRVLEDEWTVVTADGSRSAHFEHTIAITKNGARILTKI